MPGDRISIFASGKETVIADWDDIVQEGADHAPDNKLQIVEYFRGAAPKIFDRVNVMEQFQIVVTKDWESSNAAFDFWMRIRALVPRLGNVTWKGRDTSGTLSRSIVGCGIKVRPVRRLGSVTMIQYTIIGGQIQTSPISTAAS